jgi:hypothetical protein
MLLDEKPATAASDTSAFRPCSNATGCVTLDCRYKEETSGETESQALFRFHPFVDAQTSISCSYVMRKDTSETKLNCRQNWVKLDRCVTYEQRPADMIRILRSPLHCQTDRQVPVTTRCAHRKHMHSSRLYDVITNTYRNTDRIIRLWTKNMKPAIRISTLAQRGIWSQ